VRNLIKAAAVTMAMTAGLLIPANPASAGEPSDPACAFSLCMFTSNNQTGSHNVTNLSAGCKNMVYPFIESISSYWNGSNKRYRAYKNYGCTGSFIYLYGSGDGNIVGSWNNAIVAVAWLGEEG
jgi:hypothetical protein